MSRLGIESLVFALDNALAGHKERTGEDWHSVLGNLGAVPAEAWDWVPPGGSRSIRQVVEHLAGIRVWDSQAFRNGAEHWTRPETVKWLPRTATPAAAAEWLRESVCRFRESVLELGEDSELMRLRLSPQGPMQETRWIIVTMIEHLLYHCGEINHIRALLQENDEEGND